jgi:uridine kinase
MEKERKISLLFNGKEISARAGVTVGDLLEQAPHPGDYPALGAVIDNRVDGLYYELKSDANVETVDLTNREGMDIYRRTATIILCAAMKAIDPNARLQVGQSLVDNYFFEVHNHDVTPKLLRSLEEKMRELIEADVPLMPVWTVVEEGIRVFREDGQLDKELLLRQLRRSEVPLVALGGYRSYVQGPVAERTGLIDRFKLHHYEHGVVLGFPNREGSLAEAIPPQPKLFNTYLEAKRWNEVVQSDNVAQLNQQCIEGKISDLVKVAEALHEKKIAAIADEIVERRKDARLVLIAGPSGSGKTTFTKRLAIQLKVHGIEPVLISIDNYYVDRDKTPRHSDGSHNFECLEALDVELFSDHVGRLIKGQEVETPIYSFPLGKRDPHRTRPMKLGSNQILITEGIHGLNDELSPNIPAGHKFKVYVSALTQLCIDDHNRIFTSDTRLIRRIVRDRLFRGTKASDTIMGWPSVRRGEGKYIFPYQESADVVFNSALPYEHSVFKPIAERFLAEVQREDSAFMEVMRIYRFFAFFIPIMTREVPHTSIVREFIGGSAFQYR